MRFRKLAPCVTLAATLAIATPTEAATEFEDGYVPVELVSLLLGSGKIYRSLPDDFPVVRPPSWLDIRIVGSMDLGEFQQVLLRSPQGNRVLLVALREAYMADGWIELSGAGNVATMLCRDGLGNLQMIARDQGDLLPVLRIRTSGYGSCADQLAMQQGMESAYLYIGQSLPLLAVPPETVAQRSELSTGVRAVSGAHYTWDQYSRIVVHDIDAGTLHAHYAARLVEQGWSNDTTAHGTVSTMSMWYKTLAPPTYAPEAGNTQLAFTLAVQSLGDDTYRLQASFHAELAADAVRGNYATDPDVLGQPLTSAELGIRGVPAGYASTAD